MLYRTTVSSLCLSLSVCLFSFQCVCWFIIFLDICFCLAIYPYHFIQSCVSLCLYLFILICLSISLYPSLHSSPYLSSCLFLYSYLIYVREMTSLPSFRRTFYYKYCTTVSFLSFCLFVCLFIFQCVRLYLLWCMSGPCCIYEFSLSITMYLEF